MITEAESDDVLRVNQFTGIFWNQAATFLTAFLQGWGNRQNTEGFLK